LILHGGFVYGLDDGILACVDVATGEKKWQGDRHGHGQMLLVGDVILLMAENGEVLLISPSPEEEKIVARFRALKSKTWNPPALAGEYLLVRNDIEAACFRVRLKK
jgi:outer membrane protein assembly factor BamB